MIGGFSSSGGRRLGRSQAAHPGKGGEIKEIDEEGEFARAADEYTDSIGKTPQKGGRKSSQKQRRGEVDGDVSVSAFGKKHEKAAKKLDSSMKNVLIKTNTLVANLDKKQSAKGKGVKGPDSVFAGDDEDQERLIFSKLRSFDVFEPVDPNAPIINSSSNQKNITSETEQKWRYIASSGNNERDKQDAVIQGDGKLSNIKVHKKNLNSYLRKHYTPRLASKLTSLFNW